MIFKLGSSQESSDVRLFQTTENGLNLSNSDKPEIHSGKQLTFTDHNLANVFNKEEDPNKTHS